MIMNEEKEISDQQKCVNEIEEILKKYNCYFIIDFEKANVMGNEVLVYKQRIVKGS